MIKSMQKFLKTNHLSLRQLSKKTNINHSTLWCEFQKPPKYWRFGTIIAISKGMHKNIFDIVEYFIK